MVQAWANTIRPERLQIPSTHPSAGTPSPRNCAPFSKPERGIFSKPIDSSRPVGPGGDLCPVRRKLVVCLVVGTATIAHGRVTCDLLPPRGSLRSVLAGDELGVTSPIPSHEFVESVEILKVLRQGRQFLDYRRGTESLDPGGAP